MRQVEARVVALFLCVLNDAAAACCQLSVCSGSFGRHQVTILDIMIADLQCLVCQTDDFCVRS